MTMPKIKGLGVCLVMIFLSGCAEIANKTEPPVRVNLVSFLVSKGYYVVITNTHETVILENVSIEYTDGNGKTSTQTVGTIRPKEAKSLDPSDIKWRVERNEKISIKAGGYLTKTINVNSLLD